MTAISPRREAGLVALLALAWLAATAGVRPLMLPDEGRYVGVAWEMLRSGDWLTPTLNGLPYFHKPPLFYWISAGAVALFGHHELAARAAPLLGAWLGAMALFLFLRRWADTGQARLAWMALVALLVQPLFLLGGQFANLDMLVAGCISATVLLVADAALSFEQGLPHRRTRLAAYAMAALGVLAKGLIGAVLPALIVAAWLLLRRRWRTLLALWSWAGLGVFVLLALPWFVAMEMRFDGFLDYFFVVQHFKRFAAAGFNNVEPFWFFPAVLLGLSLPWWPWLLRAARGRGVAASPVQGLLLVWLLVVVGFFSWPQSKLVGYVLPAVPPLAGLMAMGAAGGLSLAARRGLWASAAVSAAVSFGAVGYLALHPQHSTREIGRTLAALRQPQQPVFLVGGAYFDLGWYARLDAPPHIVEPSWHDDAAARDDWRKELVDAGHFAPVRAQQLLLDGGRLPAALCAVPLAWVVGPDAAAAQLPATAEVVAQVRGTTLWRVPAAQVMACAEKPNGDPADN